MNRKISKLSLTALLSLVTLVGCGNDNKGETSNSSSETSTQQTSSAVTSVDVELPTTIPTMNEESVQIHYQREDGKYSSWALWLWAKGVDGNEFQFNYRDDFGVVASYPLSQFGTATKEAGLGFIVKSKGSWNAKDTENDRFIDFSRLEKDTNGVYHIYIFQDDANIYLSKEKKVAEDISACKFMKGTSSYYIRTSTNLPMSHITLKAGDQVLVDENLDKKRTFEYNGFNDTNKVDISKEYVVTVTFAESGAVLSKTADISAIYQDAQFDEDYYYDGELGALYAKDKTTFRVWSPISTDIKLRVYDNGTPVSVNAEKGSDEYTEYTMTKGSKGVFESVVEGDLEGKYYTYVVTNYAHKMGQEIVDPYAKSCGVSSKRGMIVDFSKTNPEGWDEIAPKAYDSKELTVYETHVADVTSSSSWGGSAANSKKYLGLVEEGTKYNTHSTGFDHIKELGVNAVQILPFFDQANDETKQEFNWGYNPENYNCLEGSYSSNPYDGYARIKEFKQVVKKYNEAGINIIMDVVYNHVNGATGSNFDVLMPGYYFRYLNGKLTNGSGCGNETASENKMVQKFILDSTKFWASEYKLGGFRFDLMGLHDIDTMNLVKKELKEKVNSSITVYGEPWTGGTSGLTKKGVVPATQANGNSLVGVAEFNDQMRDALIKGGLSGVGEKGWITSTSSPSEADIEKILGGLQGNIVGATKISDPDKVVNYVTCHDNYTLKDRIEAAGITDVATQRSMAMLANSVVFTSQGTTFMLAGEEMFRTKQGNSNSYNASYEINELDYSKLDDPEVAKMFENYKALIAYKKNTAALHLGKDDIKNAMVTSSLDNGNTLKYTLSDVDKEYIVLHTNGYAGSHSAVDLSGYTLYLDTTGTLSGTLGSVTPTSYQTIIAYKNK